MALTTLDSAGKSIPVKSAADPSAASGRQRNPKPRSKCRRPGRPAILPRLIIWSALSAAFTAMVVQYSLRHGRLILFPSFDDVGYMADGIQRLHTFYIHGMAGFLGEYVRMPPHSPYSDLLATASFAIFGAHDWAPYAGSAILVLILLASIDSFLSGIPLWQRTLIYLFALTMPLSAIAVHEFRPDLCCSLVTATGVLFTVGRPLTTSSRGRQLAIGTLFGAAMLIKPPVFPATATFFLASLAASTAADWFSGRPTPKFKSLIVCWLTCLIPFILIPLPHYILNGRAILQYIYDNMFGAHRSTWESKEPLAGQLLYYITGFGGSMMLRLDVRVLAVLLAVGTAHHLWLAHRPRLLRMSAVTAMLFLAYLIPTMNHIKQQFFGLTFQIMLVLASVCVLKNWLLIERYRRPRVPVATFVLLATLLYSFDVFRMPAAWGDYTSPWIVDRRQNAYDLYHAVLQNDTTVGRPVRVFATFTGDANPSLLNYMALRDQIPLECYSLPDSSDVAPTLAELDHTDFALAAESGSGLVADFLLSSALQDRVLAALRAREDFVEVAHATFHQTSKNIYLFKNDPFHGWEAVEGFGGVEGPLPDAWAVQWGMGPRSVLRFNAGRDGAFRLDCSARNAFAGQVMVVKLDGLQVARKKLPPSTKFADISIPLTLKKGTHRIELDYALWDKTSPRPAAVLFDLLRVMPRDWPRN